MVASVASPPPAPPPRRPRRWPWVLAALLVVLVVPIVALTAWLGTEAALHYVVEQVAARSDGRIAITGAHGSLLSTVQAETLTYADAEKQIVAHDVAFTWSPMMLLSRELHVNDLGAASLEVRLGSGGKSSLPESLALPLRVVVERAHVGLLDLRSGAARWPIRDIRFAYRGGRDGHRLHDVALSAEQGTVVGQVQIGAERPFDVRGKFVLEGTPALRSPHLDVVASGSLVALTLDATGAIANAAISGRVALAPVEDVPLKSVDLTVRELDLHGIDPRLPTTALTAEMHGQAAADAILAGTFNAVNAASGSLDRERVPVARLTTSFVLAHDAIRARGLDATLAGGGTVRGNAAIQLAADAAGASDWALVLRDVDLRALHGRLVPTKLSGKIDATVRDNVEQVHAVVSQADMALDATAAIAGTTITLQRFALSARGGMLRGKGRFDWSGARAFALDASAERFDPSRFGEFPVASLDGTITAEGALQPAPTATGTLTLAGTSRLRGVALGGTIAGAYATQRVRDVRVDLAVAGGTLRADGSLGRTGDRLRFRVDAPRLAAWTALLGTDTAVQGSVSASGELVGAFDALGGTLEGHAAKLALDDNTIGQLDVRARIAPGAGYSRAALQGRDLRIEVHVRDATLHGRPNVQRVDATVTGSLARHDLALAVRAPDMDVDLDLGAQGGLRPASTWDAGALAWSGTLNSFENRGTYTARLVAPTAVSVSSTHVTVADARVALAEGSVTVASFDWNAGRITTRGDFTGLPVAALVRMSGANVPMRTTLVLGGDWNLAATPRLNGTLHVRRERGDVFASTEGVLDQPELALGLTVLELAATVKDDALDLQANVRAARVGDVTAQVAVGAGADGIRHLAPGASLRGSVRADLASLKVLQPFLGTNALVDGALHADLALGGTVGAPAVTGSVRGTGLRVDAPQYGIVWRDGVLSAHADANALTVDEFSVAGGDGRFRISGTIPFAVLRDPKAHAGEAQVAWRADHFRATNRPDLRLVTTGEGTVGWARGRLSLRGKMHIDEGQIEFGQRAGTRLGEDVVIVGRPRPAPRRKFEEVPLDLTLDVDLGTRLLVQGSGLRTTLEGNARFATTAGGTLTARGTLRTVRGTYAAFGQRLSIERGTLVFDGPIDNPTLDIVALRKNLPVEAGVQLTGTARLPRVQLTSNPPVSEGEKLSWLVLGQGLERTSGTDIAALQAAAAALFGSDGPSVGTRVAQRIGLDDLAIRSASGAGASSTPGLNSQVLAFSKRITDRLFVVYEAGLDIANNTLRLEYALTRSFTLRVQAGMVSSLGLYFLRSYQ